MENGSFTIEVKNSFHETNYIALLDLANDGSVELIYPQAGQQELLVPRKTWVHKLETSVLDGRVIVRGVIKLIASPQPADFSFLRREPVTRGTKLAVTRGKATQSS